MDFVDAEAQVSSAPHGLDQAKRLILVPGLPIEETPDLQVQLIGAMHRTDPKRKEWIPYSVVHFLKETNTSYVPEKEMGRHGGTDVGRMLMVSVDFAE